MKIVLITGGAGFVGKNLSKKLLDLGYYVIAIDNLITSSETTLKSLIKHPRFTFIKHDITLPSSTLIQKLSAISHQPLAISHIYHLACPTGVPNVTRLAEEMLLTCSMGTRNILELAKAVNAKILFSSSSEAYGDPLIFPQEETYTGNVDSIGIRSSYEEGKRFSESLCVMYARKYGVNAKIVRIFNTYGPNMDLSDTRIIPRFINRILTGKPLPIQGDGNQTRTFCYIDDLLDGFMAVMENGERGEVYNLGSDQEVTIKELAVYFRKVTGNRFLIKYIDRPSHDHQGRHPSLDKIKGLGWEQKVSLEAGLKKTLEWYGYQTEKTIHYEVRSPHWN